MLRLRTLTYCLCLLTVAVQSLCAEDSRLDDRAVVMRTAYARQAATEFGQLDDLRLAAPTDNVLDAIVNKSIGQVRTDISLPAADPQGGALTRPESAVRGQGQIVQTLDQLKAMEHWEFNWSAPGSSHRPLYFEEANLERHGYSSFGCLTPVASAAHFFGTVPFLPYKTTVNRPHEQIYTLGHYRPGSCVPYQINTPPLYLDAAAVQLLAVAGGVFLIP